MRRVARLAIFAVAVTLVVGLLVYGFRGSILRFVGISLDVGAGGETSLQLAEGIAANVFASGLSGPRFMAVSPDGTLFVAERGADRVVALRDRDRDGRADEIVVVGSGYDSAHSLAFQPDGRLLVAGTTTVFRVAVDTGLREVDRSVFLDGLPEGGAHTTRTVAVRLDGSVLVSVGSSCNVCDEVDERRATVLAVPALGGSARIMMRGLRNAVGLAIDPLTGDAWATNMGRDFLGDHAPPETLYRLVDGADAGWPRCHAGSIPDPEFGTRPDPSTGAIACESVTAPAATFQAHAAPLGLAFWRGRAVIAFHGSWNRSTKVGYEVLWFDWSDGPSGPPEVLAGGFLDPVTEDSSGRPAGLVVGSDEAIYVSDDKGGFIYRLEGG